MSRRRLQQGDRVGEFTIVAYLDEGIEGAVYHARHPQHGDVALKLPFSNPATLIQLALEVDNREKLRVAGDTTIANTMLAASLSEPRYLATRLASGGSLDAWLAHNGALPFARALRTAEALERHVAVLWRLGLWYFDLRADNVVVEAPARFDEAALRLIDFGAAAPVTPLLRFERWPYNRQGWLPPRGMGWVFAPREGPDERLPMALLLLQCLTGVRPFHVRALRSLMFGEWSLDPNTLPTEACPSEWRQWLCELLGPRDEPRQPPALPPPPEGADLGPIHGWPRFRADAYSASLLAALGHSLAVHPVARVLPVRLPLNVEDAPERLAVAVVEQLRVQLRFLRDDVLALELAPLSDDVLATSWLARWSPLLFQRMQALALPMASEPVDDAQMAAALCRVLSALAHGAPVVVVLLCEGAGRFGSALAALEREVSGGGGPGVYFVHIDALPQTLAELTSVSGRGQ